MEQPDILSVHGHESLSVSILGEIEHLVGGNRDAFAQKSEVHSDEGFIRVKSKKMLFEHPLSNLFDSESI